MTAELNELTGSEPSGVEDSALGILTEDDIAEVKTEATKEESESAESVPVVSAEEAEADAILNALLGRIGDITQTTKYTKVLIFGQPGVGKTVFSATTPNTLIVDVERGAISVNNHPELKNNAKFMEFRSVFQLEQLIEFLKKDHAAFEQYDTLVVDSFTALQQKDLDEIVAEEARKDASRNKFLPLGPDYNVNTKHMQKIAADLRDINKNIIITCHAKEVKNDVTGVVLTRPDVTPRLAQSLNGIFDVVGYLSTDGDKRTLQCHPTKEISAKTRLSGLPPVMENPTFSAILEAKKKSLDSVNSSKE